MARFCVKCGSGLDPDARFCDECGTPVRARPDAQPTPLATSMERPAPAGAPVATSAAPLDVNWRRVGLWSGIGMAVLLAAGGVAAFLAMPPSTPTASDLTGLLNADMAKVASTTCLSNFAYGTNPVIVGGFDINTQQWLQVLSKAGIYGPPQPVTSALLFGGGQQYAHTPLGEKKIHDGKLCFADGLTVSTVQFTKPVKIGERWHTQGSYGYTYRNADAWIQTPEAQRAEPDHFANLPKTAYVSLVKGDHGWQFDNVANGMSSNDEPGLLNGLQGRVNTDASADRGLFSKIANAVSGLFAARPAYIGKWRDDEGTGSVVEFTRDRAIFDGQATPIIYEADHRDNKRIHLMRGGVSVATIRLIDSDHLEFSLGFGGARLHRVE